MSLQEAVDTHMHVIDRARFPYSPGPGYKPGEDEQAPFEALEGVLSRHGVGHAVLVQMSGYGTDNSALLDAIARSDARFKGIAAVDPDIDEAALVALDRGGVVGVRLNVANLERDAIAGTERLISRIGALGWIVQVQCPPGLLADVRPSLGAPGARLLIDHLGLPDVDRGTRDPGFRALLDLGGAGATIKLSGAFRSSRQSFPHADLDPFVDEIKRAFPPERRVWASDWPFIRCASPPAYADTLAQLERWLPDPSERRVALVEAPRRLFGFQVPSRPRP